MRNFYQERGEKAIPMGSRASHFRSRLDALDQKSRVDPESREHGGATLGVLALWPEAETKLETGIAGRARAGRRNFLRGGLRGAIIVACRFQQ